VQNTVLLSFLAASHDLFWGLYALFSPAIDAAEPHLMVFYDNTNSGKSLVTISMQCINALVLR